MAENKDIQNQEQALQLHTMTLAEKLKYGTSASVPVGIALELFGGGFGGIAVASLIGITAAYFSEEIREGLIDKLPAPKSAGTTRRSKLSWFVTGHTSADPGQAQPPQVQPEKQTPAASPARRSVFLDDEPVTGAASVPDTDPSSIEAAFVQDVVEQVEIVPRLSVDAIVKNTVLNNYEVYIGRSLTRPNFPAVKINFYKRHIKMIGASQYGKSSMAAAMLEAITRTHDPEHVIIALLDLEDKTSKLFAHLPHVAELVTDDGPILLHSRSYEQVLEHLELVLELIDYRYTLSESDVDKEPLLIVYLEEFIDLKDYFKQLIDTCTGDAKDQAKKNYTRLVFCIKKIARRGLKVLVQLLLCTQVDYADEDLKEALVNVTSGMSFCVRVSAAHAAGFYQTALLNRNAREDKKGHAVVEMPEVKDLIQAPDYDLHQKLLVWKRLNAQTQNGASNIRPLRPVVEPTQDTFDARMRAHQESTQEAQETVIDTGQYARTYAHENPSDQPVDTAHTAYSERNDYLRMTDLQIELFCVAYGLTGNKDKSLEAAGVNTRYRQHATVIIAERDLKKRG